MAAQDEASLSTLVVVFSVAAAVAAGLSQIDPTLFDGGWHDATTSQRILSALGLLLLPAGLLIALVRRWRSAVANRRRVSATVPWPGDDRADRAIHQRLLTLCPQVSEITIRMSGGDFAAPTPPVALRYLDETRRVCPAILVDGAFMQRFRVYPDALCAVLLHEVAHHVNRDHWLLFDLRRLLLATAVIAVLQFVASVAGGIVGTGHEPAALLAVLSGKSYGLALLAAAFACLAMARASHRWREALADAFAARRVGDAAVQQAERLLHDSATGGPNAARSHAPLQATAYLLTPAYVALLGGLVGMLADMLGGRIFVWVGAHGDAGYFVSLLTLDGLMVAGFGSVLVTCANLSRDRADRIALLARATLCLVAGAVAARLLLQSAPLAFSSLMPSGYVAPFTHDIGRLLLSESIGATTMYASRAATLFVGALALYGGAPAITAWLPALTFAAVAAFEYIAFASLTYGFAAYAAGAAAATMLVARYRVVASLRTGPAMLLAMLCAAGLAGAGHTTHLASCLSRAAADAGQRGDRITAHRLFEYAARASRWHGEGWAALAITSATDADFRQAARWMTRAAQAPLDSDNAETFLRWGSAGSFWLHVGNNTETTRAARAAFGQAATHWPRMGKTDNAAAAEVFYNAACAALREPADQRAAAADLMFSVMLHPPVARAARADADLQELWRTADPPSPVAQQWLAETLGRTNTADLPAALRDSPHDAAELSALARYVVELALRQPPQG
jgi:hypothetical protein